MSTPEHRPSQFSPAPHAAPPERSPGSAAPPAPPAPTAAPTAPSSISRSLAPDEARTAAGAPGSATEPSAPHRTAPVGGRHAAPEPTAGDSADARFREAGRGELLSRPNAPHLDERLAGLDTPRNAGRTLLGRRRATPGMQNRPNDGLQRPIRSPRRISVVGMKGGVGKTTLSILTATAAARAMRVPVMLLDSDTTYGSLMLRTGLAPRASVQDLAQMGDPGDLRVLAGAVSQTRDGVWVAPTGRTPAQSAAFDEAGYVAAVRAVYRLFPVMVTDCGAGLAGPLMHRVISASHTLVIATAPSMDSILASYNTLEWLASIGYQDLARRSIVAISNVDPVNPRVDLLETRRRFAELAGDVLVVPSDPHLAPGSVLDYDALSDAARAAAEDLAGAALAAASLAP